MNRLDDLHPAVSFTYFLSVFFAVMFTRNPFVLGPGLIGAVAFFLAIDRKGRFFRDAWFYLVLFLLVVVSNPLFSHNGVTPLFFVNDNAVTLEALLYGVDLGVMLLAVLAWFRCFNEIMTSEKLLLLLGRVSPKIAVVISSALRLIPLFRDRWGEIRAVWRLTPRQDNAPFPRIRSALRSFSALITWALEHAVEMGASMKARGYERKGRTRFSLYRFTGRDLGFLLGIIAADAVFFTALALGKLEFRFYPAIRLADADALAVAAYAAFGLIAFLPVFLEIKETIQWKVCYRSRI